MLLDPPIDNLVNKVGNPYKLAVLVGKRAKYLQRNLSEEQKKEITVVTRAVNEVNEEKVIGE